MARLPKSRYSIFGVVAIVLLLVFAGANVILSKQPLTFAAWKVEALKACTKMVDKNNAAFLKIFHSDQDPTLAEFIAFKKYFVPDFEAFERELKSQDRPAEKKSEVDDFMRAVEDYRMNIQESATNIAAAKVEFAAGGQTEASMVFGKTASVLGLEKCVG